MTENVKYQSVLEYITLRKGIRIVSWNSGYIFILICHKVGFFLNWGSRSKSFKTWSMKWFYSMFMKTLWSRYTTLISQHKSRGPKWLLQSHTARKWYEWAYFLNCKRKWKSTSLETEELHIKTTSYHFFTCQNRKPFFFLNEKVQQ